MTWAMELSPSGFDEMLADLARMDRKTGRAYQQLLGYLRRFGSIPAAERALASILGISVRFLRDVAWPLLEDRLVLSDDGRRYFDPDITAANQRRAAGAPVVQEKSKQHSEASKQRWREQRERERRAAEAHADASEAHAETHVIPMRGASETHAETHPADALSASLDASDASPLVRTNSLSLSEDSLEQTIEKERVLERESSRASAGDDAPADAATHARTHKNDAPTHAEPHAQGVRPIRPVIRPIPSDWTPNAETLAEGLLIRADAEAQVQKFIRLNAGKGNTAADWNPLFLRFLEHANEYERRNPQPQAPIVIPGGRTGEPKAAEPEIEEPISGTGPEADWARVLRKLGKGVVRNWFGKAVLVGIVDGEVTISLPTPFIRDHVVKGYGSLVTTLWTELNPETQRVEFVVATAERRTADG